MARKLFATGVLMAIIALSVASFFAADNAEAFDKLPEIANIKIHSQWLASSGQPGKRQFDEIAESGVQVVINLAPKNSPDSIANEGDLVRKNGMQYHFIPVKWNKPTHDDFALFMAAMDDAKGKVVLAHCYVNSRASAFVYLYNVLRGNVDAGAEYTVLEEIWDHNEGYELRNVPHWRKFLEDTLARRRSQ
ncbi:MAG: protein tyrosine phosphatase family protein [Alphaproteobacteria bacterium]|nr:protein tyrosine phosphatase family protein [Alphaproteobacteria bacterium]